MVDDHLMKISHVFRGSEWSISTAKHLKIYRSLGWDPPKFGHLPLMLSQDGAKLSKRHGHSDLNSLRSGGFHPLAVMNYATLIGGGFKDRQRDAEKVLSVEELTERFSLDLVARYPSQVEPARLMTLNSNLIKDKLQSDPKWLVRELRECLKSKGIDNDSSDERLKEMLSFAIRNERASTVLELVGPEFEYLWKAPDSLNDISLDNLPVSDLVKVIESVSEPQALVKALRVFCKENKLKMKEVMRLIRKGVTGLEDGPPVAELAEALGVQEVASRIERLKMNTQDQSQSRL